MRTKHLVLPLTAALSACVGTGCGIVLLEAPSLNIGLARIRDPGTVRDLVAKRRPSVIGEEGRDPRLSDGRRYLGLIQRYKSREYVRSEGDYDVYEETIAEGPNLTSSRGSVVVEFNSWHAEGRLYDVR